MTDSELEKILKSASAPQRTPDYWQEFPQHVARKLKTPSSQEKRICERPWTPRLVWAAAMACICLILGFAAGQWHAMKKNNPSALLQNEKMVHEILTMFPNRVRAIVQTEKGMQLVLSDAPDVPASTPIWIKVGDQTAVTFSGQEIQIGGEKMTVLSDAQGGVILMAKQLIWSSTLPSHLNIQAKPMGPQAL